MKNQYTTTGDVNQMAMEILAKRTVLVHLREALLLFLGFEFIRSIAEFSWAIQRLFRIGDYGKRGHFAIHRIRWWEAPVKNLTQSSSIVGYDGNGRETKVISYKEKEGTSFVETVETKGDR